MASAALSLSIHSLFFSLLLCSTHQTANGGADQSFRVIRTGPSKPRTVGCSTPKNGSNHTSLMIANRYGPCSPIGNKKPPTLGEILRHDQDRVNYLQRRLSKGLWRGGNGTQDSDVSTPAVLGDALGTLEYVATVGFGTPKLDQTLVLDTGSDINWIQCNPCSRCYSQKEPMFDPSQSSTYSSLSCGSPECGQQRGTSCSGSSCNYEVLYGDGSTTTGPLSRDTLTISPGEVINGFVFGCGESNQGLFEGTAGLMGLGRGQLSLVSQASKKFGTGGFSYCLPPSSSSTGYLAFGAPQGSGAISYTPMVNTGSSTFYYVELTAISFEGQQLAVPASVISVGGTILDSGTVITRLPPTAYNALRSAFRSYMSSAGYPTASAKGQLDTCYDFSGSNTVSMPKIAMHFGGGVTLDIDKSGILIQSCLAFIANDKDNDIGIIGNVQQRTFEVVYDLAMARIGFRPGGCS